MRIIDLLGIFNVTDKSASAWNTVIALTREYSSVFEECVYTLLGSGSSKDTTLARGKEWRGFLRLRIKGKVELS
jgi:hypothetical protein